MSKADDDKEKGAGGTAPKETVSKVDHETAMLEVTKFLDLKRVPDIRRKDDFEGSIEALIGYVEQGRMKFDFEENRATYKLMCSLKTKTGKVISELPMRFWMGAQESNLILKKIPNDDSGQRSMALVAALSANNVDILKSAKNEYEENGLDLSDHNALFHYTTFFLA
jgi:hypothetical protein